MAVFLAMLRGINVAGQKKVLMADLKALFEASGFTNVKTYIQSGNVIFESKLKEDKLIDLIEKKILEKYAFEVKVLIKNASQLESVIAGNPFLKTKDVILEKLYVTFLEGNPKEENILKLKDFSYKEDQFQIEGNIVYLYCPGGYGDSKLSNNFFESKLKVAGTTRNWKSVNELHRLMLEMEKDN